MTQLAKTLALIETLSRPLMRVQNSAGQFARKIDAPLQSASAAAAEVFDVWGTRACH